MLFIKYVFIICIECFVIIGIIVVKGCEIFGIIGN